MCDGRVIQGEGERTVMNLGALDLIQIRPRTVCRKCSWSEYYWNSVSQPAPRTHPAPSLAGRRQPEHCHGDSGCANRHIPAKTFRINAIRQRTIHSRVLTYIPTIKGDLVRWKGGGGGGGGG